MNVLLILASLSRALPEEVFNFIANRSEYLVKKENHSLIQGIVLASTEALKLTYGWIEKDESIDVLRRITTQFDSYPTNKEIQV